MHSMQVLPWRLKFLYDYNSSAVFHHNITIVKLYKQEAMPLLLQSSIGV